MNDEILTNVTRLFEARPIGETHIYLYGIGVWRIMWHGGDQRVILRTRLKDENNWLQNFPEGCFLDLIGGQCEKVEDRNQGTWLYRFANCKVNRSWIPMATALASNELAPLNYWLEIKCEILNFMQS